MQCNYDIIYDIIEIISNDSSHALFYAYYLC